VTVTPEENVALWESLLATVASSAPDIADGMAKTFQARIQNVTLRESAHAPGQFYRAPRGHPPAYASGTLARSIIRRPAFGGVRATGSVGATAVYAAIQEFGGYTWGNHGLMHWRNSAGEWFMNDVYVPEHPYFRPTVEATIRDGSLQRSAIVAFEAHMSPLIR
jgi:phage gpG-like protein